MSTLQVGLNLLKYNIYLGAWYKASFGGLEGANAAVLLVGYRYTFAEDMSIKFIYSYDLMTSANMQGLGGAHEISLVLDFDKLSLFGGGGGAPTRSMRNGNALECPSFY
jgi:hypothetical protein